MWEINSLSQLIGFMYSALFGIICCLAYDLLRAFRAVTRPHNITVFIQDILFSVLCAFACFCLLLAITLGEIRIFVFAGIAVGFFICRFTLSKAFFFVFYKGFKWAYRFLHMLGEYFKAFFAFADRSADILRRKVRKFCKFLLNKLKNS